MAVTGEGKDWRGDYQETLDIAHYERHFSELEALAMYEDVARNLLARIGAEYRRC